MTASCAVAYAAQATLLADTYVTSARPSTNYGALSNLYVNAAGTALVRFDATAVPAGTAAGQIGRAVLRVYVNRLNTPGTLAVAPVGADWREAAVTFQTLPIAGSVVDVEAATDEGQYLAFDVTAIVKAWTTAPATNFGFSLTTTSADVVLDSKENDSTAHPAQLDVSLLAGTGPAGAKGDPGATGPQGPAGPQGPVGATGPAGPAGAIGPQGLQGVAGPKGDAGGLSYAGAYAAAAIYAANDVVSYGGAAWVSLVNANIGVAPGSDSVHWGVLVPAATSSGTGTTVTATPSLAYKGVYSAVAGYGVNDVVTYASAAWVSVAFANVGNTPGSASSFWAVLVPAAAPSAGGAGTSASTSLGYKGVYDSTANYGTNDVVTYANAAWVSVAASNHGNTPDSSPADWAVLVPAAQTAATAPVVTKSLAFQGAYASATNYALNDVVSWQSAAWISLVTANHGNTPDASPAFWAVLVPAAVGLTGPQGPAGAAGAQGPQGERGYQGSVGLQGPAGLTGATGPAGLTYQGAYQSAVNYAVGDVTMWQGSSYTSLVDANHGNTPSLSPAQWGLLTSTGPQGATGQTGAPGPQGPPGTAGQMGSPGQQGPTGPVGSTGPQGVPGRDGAQGPQGDRGLTGSQGAPGPVGIAFQGVYASATNYALNDVVTWQGQTWLSLNATNHGNTPGTTADWTLLAAQGGAGPQGAQGLQGPQGLPGTTGQTGAQGPQGSTGLSGPQGDPGSTFQGPFASATSYALHDAVSYAGGTWLSLTAANHGNTPGTTTDWAQMAAPGATGAPGAQGIQGPPGTAGPQGLQGAQGNAGPAGLSGPQGPPAAFRGAWDAGAAYQTGDAVFYNGSSWVAMSAISGTPPGSAPQWTLLAQQGSAGAPGGQGSQGPAGQQGTAGQTGPAGQQGAPGLQWQGTYNAQTNYALRDAVLLNGSTYVSIATPNTGNTPGAAGVTQWTLLAQAGANGANGAAGLNGNDGAAATIAVNSVTSGTVASVSNSGTSSAARFDFVLPKGDAGATGAAGPAGLTFRGAWVANNGYSKGDAVSLNGSSYVSLVAANTANPATDVANNGGNWAVLASAGATGSQGANGAATVSIGAVSGGSSAAVTNSGSSSAAILNFVLPQGAQGVAGPAGLTWQGAWAAGTQYATNDAVSYGGSAYIAIANSKGVAPTGVAQSPSAWSVLASQGSTGATGATPTFTIGPTTTGAAGSAASVAIGTSGTVNTLTFTIPQGATGAAGTNGTNGGSGNAGAVFSSVHTVGSKDLGAQIYSAMADSTGGAETPSLMNLLPSVCTLSAVTVYNTGTTGAIFEFRTGSTPASSAFATQFSCTLAAGAGTCSPASSIAIGGKFVDLRITSATSGTSYVYATFACN